MKEEKHQRTGGFFAGLLYGAAIGAGLYYFLKTEKGQRKAKELKKALEKKTKEALKLAKEANKTIDKHAKSAIKEVKKVKEQAVNVKEQVEKKIVAEKKNLDKILPVSNHLRRRFFKGIKNNSKK